MKDVIHLVRESLGNIDVDFSEREVARKVGLIQGLEALLTYDPEFTDEGEVIIDES